MRLISLEEWERMVDRHRSDPLGSSGLNDPNGIECPKCGKELVDDNRNCVLTSCPPQLRIHCQACGWRGYRHIA